MFYFKTLISILALTVSVYVNANCTNFTTPTYEQFESKALTEAKVQKVSYFSYVNIQSSYQRIGLKVYFKSGKAAGEPFNCHAYDIAVAINMIGDTATYRDKSDALQKVRQDFLMAMSLGYAVDATIYALGATSSSSVRANVLIRQDLFTVNEDDTKRNFSIYRMD